MPKSSVLLLIATLTTLPTALHAQTRGSLITVGPSRDPTPSSNTARKLHSPFPDVIYIAPVPNAPFTATIVGDRTSMSSVAPNSQTGQVVFAGNNRTVARNAAGQVVMEQRAWVHNGQKETSDLLSIDFLDPSHKKFLRCVTQDKTCYLFSLRATPQGYLTYTTRNFPVFGVTPEQLGNIHGPTFKTLGDKTLDGMAAAGYRSRMETALNGIEDRVTRTPSTQNDIETFTSEVWYSADLQADLKMTYSNSNGDHTDTLKDIKRGDPDAKMFMVPGGYKIVVGGAVE